VFHDGLNQYLATGARWAEPFWLVVFASELPFDHPERRATIEQAFEAVKSTQERGTMPSFIVKAAT